MGGICLNEDNSHYFSTRAGKKITREELKTWVEQYADTQVKEIMLCVNAMKTSYESKVWEAIWKGYNPEGDDEQPILAGLPPEERKGARGWIHTAWQIHNDGIDIYEEWIKHCRKCSISPWISMRMNDVHGVDNEESFMHSSFWHTHPEFRRVNYKCTSWLDKAFNYGVEEVRNHHFKLIEELAERYDFDGFELDWMRFGFYFRPGHEDEGVEILNEFMLKVRKLLDHWEQKRGHRIKLGVRVPSRPQTALGLGMDAVTWARRRLVDLIVITPFWETIETDMPVEIWKQLLDGTDVKLAAGLEVLIRAFPNSTLFQTNSLETVRGAAISLLSRGVDRIYLFNYMDSETTVEDNNNYQNILCETGNIETLIDKPRRHVLTYPDTWAPGEPKAIKLPTQCIPGHYNDFRIHIGQKPNKGKINVILGITGDKILNEKSFKVFLNGKKCSFEGIADLSNPRPEGTAYSYNAPYVSVLDGYNVIEVLAEDKLTKDELEINWVEISVVP